MISLRCFIVQWNGITKKLSNWNWVVRLCIPAQPGSDKVQVPFSWHVARIFIPRVMTVSNPGKQGSVIGMPDLYCEKKGSALKSSRYTPVVSIGRVLGQVITEMKKECATAKNRFTTRAIWHNFKSVGIKTVLVYVCGLVSGCLPAYLPVCTGMIDHVSLSLSVFLSKKSESPSSYMRTKMVLGKQTLWRWIVENWRRAQEAQHIFLQVFRLHVAGGGFALF